MKQRVWRIASEIEDLRKLNSLLRVKADKLVHTGNTAQLQIQELIGAIATAAELGGETIDAFWSTPAYAVEMNIMAELADLADLQAKPPIHEKRAEAVLPQNMPELVEEQAKLKSTKQSETDCKNKLLTLVKYLISAQSRLAKRRDSLQQSLELMSRRRQPHCTS